MATPRGVCRAAQRLDRSVHLAGDNHEGNDRVRPAKLSTGTRGRGTKIFISAHSVMLNPCWMCRRKASAWSAVSAGMRHGTLHCSSTLTANCTVTARQTRDRRTEHRRAVLLSSRARRSHLVPRRIDGVTCMCLVEVKFAPGRASTVRPPMVLMTVPLSVNRTRVFHLHSLAASQDTPLLQTHQQRWMRINGQKTL